MLILLNSGRFPAQALRPLHEKLFCQANPIPVKWALHRAGRVGPGIRSPLAPLEEQFRADVDDALTAAGIAVVGDE